MPVYLDNDIYGHLECTGDQYDGIAPADRDFLYKCAASQRISVYFSAINCLELANMLSGDLAKLERIAKVASQLCPIRRLTKATSQIIRDDIRYGLEHQRGRRVDVRARSADRHGLKGEDWIITHT